jgi:hypothetical protein
MEYVTATLQISQHGRKTRRVNNGMERYDGDYSSEFYMPVSLQGARKELKQNAKRMMS